MVFRFTAEVFFAIQTYTTETAEWRQYISDFGLRCGTKHWLIHSPHSPLIWRVSKSAKYGLSLWPQFKALESRNEARTGLERRQRSFAVNGLTIWNSLPPAPRAPELSQNAFIYVHWTRTCSRTPGTVDVLILAPNINTLTYILTFTYFHLGSSDVLHKFCVDRSSRLWEPDRTRLPLRNGSQCLLWRALVSKQISPTHRKTKTRCSAIAERPRCRMRYSFRQK